VNKSSFGLPCAGEFTCESCDCDCYTVPLHCPREITRRAHVEWFLSFSVSATIVINKHCIQLFVVCFPVNHNDAGGGAEYLSVHHGVITASSVTSRAPTLHSKVVLGCVL